MMRICPDIGSLVPVEPATMSCTEQTLLQWAHRIRYDITAMSSMQAQCSNDTELEASLYTRLETLRRLATLRHIAVSVRPLAVSRMHSHSWQRDECNEMSNFNRYRTRFGLHPIHYPIPEERLFGIRETYKQAQNTISVLAELVAALEGLSTSDPQSSAPADLADIVHAVRQYKELVNADIQTIPTATVALFREYELQKKRLVQETRDQCDSLAQSVRFTADEIVAIVLRCTAKTKELNDTAPTEFARYYVQKQAPARELVEFKNAALVKATACNQILPAQLEPYTQSRFVMLTYDAASCTMLTADTIPSAMRVWSAKHCSIMCSYIEFSSQQQYPYVVSFMECAGVKLKPVHGCPSIAMGTSAIRMHPSMFRLMQDCCRMGPNFQFTSTGDCSMLEPPFALAQAARHNIWDAQLVMAGLARHARKLIEATNPTDSISKTDRQQIQDAQYRLLRALQGVRHVQIIVHKRLTEGLRASATRQLQLQRRIDEINQKLEAQA